MGFFSNRRNGIVESHLKHMVNSGISEADVPSLYFDAACRYAQDHGGKLYSDMRDSIIFDKALDGENYSVFFFLGRGGKGTNITLTKQRSASAIAEEQVWDFVNTSRASPVLEAVKESYAQPPRVVRSRLVDGDSVRAFFELYATSIPSKSIVDETGPIQFGLVEIPELGKMAVMAAILNGEGLVIAPGKIEFELTSANRDAVLAWQNESFEEFREVIGTEAGKQSPEKSGAG